MNGQKKSGVEKGRLLLNGLTTTQNKGSRSHSQRRRDSKKRCNGAQSGKTKTTTSPPSKTTRTGTAARWMQYKISERGQDTRIGERKVRGMIGKEGRTEDKCRRATKKKYEWGTQSARGGRKGERQRVKEFETNTF